MQLLSFSSPSSEARFQYGVWLFLWIGWQIKPMIYGLRMGTNHAVIGFENIGSAQRTFRCSCGEKFLIIQDVGHRGGVASFFFAV